MRVSSAAIFTLATLAATNVTKQAKAVPNPTTKTTETKDVVIVPFGEQLPTQEITVQTTPENAQAIEFTAESTVNKDPVVIEQPNNEVKPPPVARRDLTTSVSPLQSDVVIVPFGEQLPVPTTPEPELAVEFSAPRVEKPTDKVKKTVAVRNDSAMRISAISANTDKSLVVTATDVQIVGANPELEEIIRKVIKTQIGGETSQNQLQKDVAAILDTGLFASVNVDSVGTNAGLDVVFSVKPVVVKALQLSEAKVLTYKVALEKFQGQIGKDISPAGLRQVVQEINKWYADNGYTVARVLSIKPSANGILTVNVAEGLVKEIKFRFVGEDNKTVDKNGKPVEGRTKTDFLRQQLKFKPGQVFQDVAVRQDVQRLLQLGLFQAVNVSFAGDAKNLDLIYDLKEAGARSVNLGGSYNSEDGLSVILSYQDQNVGGVNDRITANLGVGREILFDSKFTSPYRETNPERLGYSINAFRRRETSYTFDDQIKLPNGDKVREGRIGGGFSLQQKVENWDASVGLNYTRTTIRDRQGNITPVDAQNNPLSWSGTGVDDLTTVSFSASKDGRDNPTKPTQGDYLSFSTEQSVPIGQGQISLNRLRANYSQYLPVKVFESKQPQVLAFNFQAGTVIGDLPPYEAFNLGGTNSVRGYDNGKVGSGRSYFLASAEYRFPIFPIAGGVLFADFASDLGSGDTVLGDPAGVREKPGSGFGYGAGLRVDSPLGLIRADYGFNNQGDSRFHFGFGQRF
ncbi:MAG TPA: outer membrane protein assembly factor [Nostocaceae cyanobacterium]|nr:outer membrane protein assembly factor [Nostocaceae cyanobacterium]